MATRKRVGAGRPPIQLDLERLKTLASLHCTYEEIAAALNVSVRTIERRAAEDEEFREKLERGRADGRRSLRRTLMQLALQAGAPNAPSGAVSALIFLAKQPLSQGGLGFRDRWDEDPAALAAGHQLDEEQADEARRDLGDKLDRLAKRTPNKKPTRAA